MKYFDQYVADNNNTFPKYSLLIIIANRTINFCNLCHNLEF